MTPPVKKPAVNQAPAVEEKKPAEPAKPAAEAKPADAKPAVEAKPAEAAASGFTFASLDAWALPITLGGGYRNFGNDQGMDHGGFNFRIAPGMRFELGSEKRFVLSPRLFYEYQGLSKDLGEGVTSEASVHAFGAEVEAAYKVHPQWFTVGALLGIGLAHYSAPFGKDGLTGAEFNKNALLFPLDENGVRVDLGLKACTWGDAVCAGMGYALDTGVNPQPKVIDGDYPAVGFSPAGFKFGLSIDPIRVVQNIVSKKKEEKKEEPKTEVKAAAAAKPEVKALTGLPLFEKRVRDTEILSNGAQEKIKPSSDDAKAIRLEKDPAKQKALAMDAREMFRQAKARVDEADAYVAELTAQIGKLPEGDKAKGAELLKKAESNAETTNRYARIVWFNADVAVKAYNKGKAKDDAVDFPDSNPPARGAKIGGGATAAKPKVVTKVVDGDKNKAATKPQETVKPSKGDPADAIDWGKEGN